MFLIFTKLCPTLAWWRIEAYQVDFPATWKFPHPCQVCHPPITEGGLNLINSLGIPLGRACASSLSVNRRTNCKLDLAFSSGAHSRI